jgi:HPt (histidine-containing phosphotransfer) domain-containing protein
MRSGASSKADMPEESRIAIEVDEDIIDLAEGFIENRLADAELLHQAIADANWTTLHRIGHELKGTAGSYGFRDLSALGLELETAAAARNAAGAADAAGRMLNYLARVRVLPR